MSEYGIWGASLISRKRKRKKKRTKKEEKCVRIHAQRKKKKKEKKKEEIKGLRPLSIVLFEFLLLLYHWFEMIVIVGLSCWAGFIVHESYNER